VTIVTVPWATDHLTCLIVGMVWTCLDHCQYRPAYGIEYFRLLLWCLLVIR